MKIQLRKPFFPEKTIKKIEENVGKCLKIGQLTLGKNTLSLEKKFAKYIGVKYACAVSSATAGLHLSLLSLDIKKGDEVIVPSKPFISTANAAVYCGAKPVFCDVDEDSFQMDLKSLKKSISKKTKVIIPVHLGGNMCPMNEINEIATKEHIHVVEDAAHAHGATLKHKKAGSFGKIGVFSFYPDKIMASSDGGIIVTNNKNIFEKIKSLRNVGRVNLGKYNFDRIGFNYRMNEIQAIIALEQLKLLPFMLKKRREIASIYSNELSKITEIKPQKIIPDCNPSYYAYILRFLKGNTFVPRNKLKQFGIETSPMFSSIYKMKPYVELFGKQDGLCPISEKLDNQTFTIPLHPGLSRNDIDFVKIKIIIQ